MAKLFDLFAVRRPAPYRRETPRADPCTSCVRLWELSFLTQLPVMWVIQTIRLRHLLLVGTLRRIHRGFISNLYSETHITGSCVGRNEAQ